MTLHETLPHSRSGGRAVFLGGLRLWPLTLVLAIVAAGCARHRSEPVAEEPAPLPVLGTITLVPVEPPANLFTNNRSAPVIGWLWVGLANSGLNMDIRYRRNVAR